MPDSPPSSNTAGPLAARGHSPWPLRFLVVVSLALPLAIFLTGAWISYYQHLDEAEQRLRRTVGTVREHAIKVFETFEISERYLEELFDDVDDAEIRSRESYFSARINNFIRNLPQLRDLWAIDGNGHPLVSGTVFPIPRSLELADRDYFRIHLTDNVDTYISDVVQARAADTNFFAITRKRLAANGAFNGVYLVSIAPEYFSRYYASLQRSEVSVAGLMRADGTVLARFPSPGSPSVKVSAGESPLMAAIKVNPDYGLTRGTSYLDDTQRIVAYNKLPNHDVFVFVGLDTGAVRAKWMAAMANHLIFGVPATLALFALTLLTMRNTRRLAAAFDRLHEESTRRQATELALRQAQKMEAVGRITGGVAHDFNNLLTAIIGNVELALRRIGEGDERIVRSLNGIRQASMRAATLVQRLLSFSRQHPQEVRTVDINRLVREMSELLHRTIGEAITIETVGASGLWRTALDPNQLENAILNLAVNARDAMPDGGRLTIETSNAYLDESYVTRQGGEVKRGQYVMVAVSDTGAGMSADVREKAFEPFFTTKPTGAGSGLGLSMVYGFVKQSGGHVQIYSEPGQGTSIKMYFPRLSDEKAFPAWNAGEPPALAAPGPTRHECILLVEDDEDVSKFAVEALGELGYRVQAAGTAAEALALLERHPEIALLFTDVVLPGGMNGRELADEVRRRRPNLPVLFATGYTRNAIIHHGRLDADVELLTKPFTTAALSRKVREILDGRIGWRVTTTSPARPLP